MIEPEPESNRRSFLELSPRAATYVVLFLALLLVGAAAFNVYLWNDSRTVKTELKAEREARLTQRQQDERTANLTKVSQCRQSIKAIKIANTVLRDLRRDHRDRAAVAERLAKIDPTEKLRQVHLGLARQERAKTKLLQDFPPVTKTTCDDLAKKLGLGPPKKGEH